MPYKEIHIADLQPGSFVVQVLQQSGDVAVKHAGWVRTAQAVRLLQQKGVKIVLVDLDKQLVSKTPEPATTTADTKKDVISPVLFSDEWPKAERLLHNTHKVQRNVLDAVRHEHPVDLSLVYEVSAGLSESVARNQDVLLCLVRIAEQSDTLLQHSVNCAIYIAAFARYLNLPGDKVQQLITAALLHDIGKTLNEDSLQQEDHLAISASLKALQKTPDLAGEVSLWISQHCANLDGSGYPKISQNQIDKGSRILAIVNSYEKLTSANDGKLSSLAANRALLERSPHQLDDGLLQLFIKCIGIYPPGSVVKLSSGKLALVLENNPKKPILPKVKVFYHSMHQHHIPAKILDLAKQQEESIDGCVDLKKYGLDVKNYL